MEADRHQRHAIRQIQGASHVGVPADYLLWLHENGKCSESVARYIEEHKPAIEQRRDTEAADRKQKTADRMPFGSYKGEVIAKVPARVSTGHV